MFSSTFRLLIENGHCLEDLAVSQRDAVFSPPTCFGMAFSRLTHVL